MVFRNQLRLGSEPVSRVRPILQAVVLVLEISPACHVIGGGSEDR